jgi:hypothetical protein
MIYPTMRFDMQRQLSSKLEVRNTKYDVNNLSHNTSYKITSTNTTTIIVMATDLLMAMILWSLIFSAPHVFAQHMMMPPAANIGDRKVTLNFQTEPAVIKSGQNVLMKVAFVDQNTKQSIKHVTVRTDVISNKDGKHILSEFFHAHDGNINVDFRPGSTTRYAVSGNMDDLTNAWVADPGSPIIVNGPVFSQPGNYKIILEVTTIDNDKTDLSQPLKYELNVPVS